MAGDRIALTGGDKFHADITGTICAAHNNGELLDITPDGKDSTVRVNVGDYCMPVLCHLPAIRPQNITGYMVCWYFSEQTDGFGEFHPSHLVFERVLNTEAEALKYAKKRQGNYTHIFYDVRPYFGDRKQWVCHDPTKPLGQLELLAV